MVVVGLSWSYEVPIDSRRFRNFKWGGFFTSLAGPFGNFTLAFLFLYLLKYVPYHLFPLPVYKSLINIFVLTIDFSIYWGVIHLIPVLPFDGGRALFYLLPTSWQERLPSSYFEKRWGSTWRDTDKDFWETFKASLKSRKSGTNKS